MKKINLIIINDEEISGEGYVEETPEGIVIEATDHTLEKYFTKAILHKIILG